MTAKDKNPGGGEPITISAKTLGQLALPQFCPRCFWISVKAERLPFQIFPGIFSVIDSYSKNLVHGWFDRHGGPPDWLRPLGEIKAYKNPPHYSKFGVIDGATSILLRGTPDGIFIMNDNSYAIIDYKTAKFTEYQDGLFPLYEAQLNSYAFIGESVGFKPISKLALVYTEPVTTKACFADGSKLTTEGFRMDFTARILPVEIKPQLVPKLLQSAKSILESPAPPAGIPGCENCMALAGLLALASS